MIQVTVRSASIVKSYRDQLKENVISKVRRLDRYFTLRVKYML